jgi:DNA-directed RNA polymerase specialized sigma24 family protein
MSGDRLQRFMDEASPQDINLWYCRQDILVSICRARLRRKIGSSFRVLEGNKEIIHETISRILKHDAQYNDDHTESLEEFFAKCLFKTVSNYWAKQKTRARRNTSLTLTHLRHHESRNTVEATQEDYIACRHWRFDEVVRANTAIRGKMLQYLKRLPRYVALGSTADDIAKDLKIKPGSLGSFRARIRRILAELEQSEKKEGNSSENITKQVRIKPGTLGPARERARRTIVESEKK